jgi:Domain of unknown function (DUF4159)
MTKERNIVLPQEGIHEIPTRPSLAKARVVSVATLLLAGLGVGAAWLLPGALNTFLGRNALLATVLDGKQITPVLLVIFELMKVTGLLCGVIGLVSLLRNPKTYRLLRAVLVVCFLLITSYVVMTWLASGVVLDLNLELDGQKQDRATLGLLWWNVSWQALALLLYIAWLQVMLRSRSVYAAFTREEGAPLEGDLTLEDLRTHGQDPRSRLSFYASLVTHILIIVIIPWLVQLGGCVEAYKVPKGSGNPVVQMVKMVKPEKKKKKTMTLRPSSAIIYEIPDLDDTEVDRVMEEQTQVQYQALANASQGKMGKGGGDKGGWPEGMDDYKIRFIRLDHGGNGWDDGMDASGADINFLRAFAKNTGFKNIAPKGEKHSIALLAKYPKDGFPPFVYLTGNGSMGSVSSSDRKILRDYCLKGGMLVADAGSPEFHRSFTHFIQSVFPDKPLLDIADDDMLYRLPYVFPEGAPAFWHHGGRRALGMKHESRWMVFYHPGDMNDAWKSAGYTDVTPEMRDAAMQLGINIVYYAFNQWDDAVAKARK